MRPASSCRRWRCRSRSSSPEAGDRAAAAADRERHTDPETGLLPTSVTRTLGLTATAVPGEATWLSPAFTAILLAAPMVSVKPLEVTVVSAVGVKVSV